MSESIVELVDRLPADNITVKVLNALSSVMPGQWENVVGFDNLVRQVTGESNPDIIRKVRDRAAALYTDSSQPYRSAMRLYGTIDKADTAMAAAALANKVGEKINFLGLLNRITPKADTIQTVDLVLKIAVELLAYTKLNGIPQPNPSTFAASLSQNYTDAALMRMTALVCLDGVLPLGPDFFNKVHAVIDNADPAVLEQNPVFSAVSNYLPGESITGKLSFIQTSFNAAQGWMQGFVNRTGVTPSGIFDRLGSFIQIADDNLDFVAAFLDQTTNYYEHTGTQTVARSVIQKAYEEVKLQQPSPTPTAAPQAATASSSYPPERIGVDGQFNQSGLAQRVSVALKKDPALSNIWVAQTGTTVVLKGQVGSQALLDRAIALAQAEPGCTEVQSTLVLVG
ncbi:MAG: BON domain-containing protein [Jaaginema sp. PMC 1079.18]|nr:BON domain-containing protein [Jaaginema sp. PMC 1080.18]MEC4853618.1 BON domain-containing protein [Jaaginema sp. PMC 1079.18]MEC4868437.1 BON domain-containing protein [Jaaginema sp. PMC 1078.18]